MPTVTVVGANNQTVSLTYNSTDVSAAAQSLMNTIGAGLKSGTITPVTFTGTPLPVSSNAALILSPSANGALIQQPDGYNVVLNDASQPVTLLGNAGSQVRVVSTDGGLNYYFGSSSSGTIVAGNGDNYVTNADPTTGNIAPEGSVYYVSVGSGHNVIALHSGRSIVSTGSGVNSVSLGSSNSDVTTSNSGGQTTIFGDVNPSAAPGTGSDTVHAGSGFVSVYGGYSNFTFIGGTGTATVQGVGGSDTVFANGSTGLFASGTGGNSIIFGGNTNATAVAVFTDAGGMHVTSGQVLVGIANGDRLIAGQNGAEWLQAGAGNETLNGAGSNGANTYYTGKNAVVNGDTFYAQTQVATGAGSSTVLGSNGFSTVTGGSGSICYEFVQGQAAGGSMTINSFNPSKDMVRLYGYAANAAQNALASAQVSGGSTVVTLSDNTKITFQGYTGGFNSNNFA